jgi:hypothetical protein
MDKVRVYLDDSGSGLFMAVVPVRLQPYVVPGKKYHKCELEALLDYIDLKVKCGS